ncbi:MAG: DEAD/DEAH box helicase, partial [Candidatus Micrarchaeota archaeon]
LMKKKGFASLTLIQERAMPEVSSGKNVLILAPTGRGKTEAAVLPILGKLAREESKEGIRLLYITPLRALNRDMVGRIEWWCSHLGVSIAVRHGDTSGSERAKQAGKPPQVLITTPETLQAILPAKKIGKALEKVGFVVVDEVHELYSDKRGSQLSVALERLMGKRGSEFQRIGLSATVGKPETVAKFLFGKRNFIVVSEGTKREMKIFAECPKKHNVAEALLEKLSLDGDSAARLLRLHELALAHRATLVFVNTRKIGEILASRMRVLEKELGEKVGKIAVHHGSLARDERIEIEKQFKNGELKGLIATSSLELGIDIGDVDLAVQYMSPRQVARLVQRVGRSGHAIGKTPKGIVIASDIDDILETVAIVGALKNGSLEVEGMQENALDVLAHQLTGLVMDWGRVPIEKAFSLVKRAGPYESLSFEQLRRVALQLKSERCLWVSEQGELAKGGKTFEYYFGNLSMIPKEKKIPVRNAATNRLVSSLDEAFALSLERGGAFITKGVPWKVLDVGEEEIVVEPSGSFESAIPDWVGEEIPVPFAIAQLVGELRGKIGESARNKEKIKLENASEGCAENVWKTLSNQRIVPTDKVVLVESCESVIVIHSLLGTKGNEALGRAVAELLTASLGASVRAEIDPYRIALLLPQPVKAEKVAGLLKGTWSPRGILEKCIPRSSLYRYRFTHVGRAFGAFGEGVRITQRLAAHFEGTPIGEETMREIFHDYLDVRVCEEFLGKVRGGSVKVFAHDVPELSPLGRSVVARISASELIMPIEPSSEVLKAFKKQLLEKRVRLLCTYCGKILYEKLDKLGKKITCHSCGSSLVGLASEKEEKAWRKAREKRKSEEKKLALELMRSASLLEAYGRRGAIALSVYGVGTETAARVLARMHENEDLLLIDLLEAQKNFIKTKRYWSA